MRNGRRTFPMRNNSEYVDIKAMGHVAEAVLKQVRLLTWI